MNIREVICDDKLQWNDYVSAHVQGAPYHQFAWVESVEQAYQHKNISLIAFEQERVVGVLPCIKMQRPFSKPGYCSLPFCDIGHGLADSDEILQAMCQKLQTSLNHENGQLFEYRDTLRLQDESQLTGKKVRMILPLPDSSKLLLAGFKSKLRSQVRKAEKNGLTFLIDNNQKQIDDFYQIFAINMRKLGSPVHSKKWFECLFSNYQDNIILSIVYTGDTPIGAGIVMRNGNKACIPWASTVAQYNKLAPNMMLYWSLLQHVCDLGCNEFDFGRSTYDEGTYKFKRQWGAEPLPLAWSNLAKPSVKSEEQVQNNSNPMRELIETVWSKLPLGITTSLGPKIRKHISL